MPAPRHFDDLLHEAETRPLSGWDLSYGGRIRTASPWDFGAIIEPYLRASPDLLDLGTGGGEWLSARPFRPARTVATEGWPPNVAVARTRLAPLGIAVVAVDGAPDNTEQDEDDDDSEGDLPFADGAFQVVISRHESYVPREIKRVLRPGGLFLTQQVASGAADDIYRLLDAPTSTEAVRWDLDYATRQLQQDGLSVEEGGESHETTEFDDVGAFAWYLAHVPFVHPDFTIAANTKQLLKLHREHTWPLVIRQPIFWVKASR